jgi:hypothetical protein
MEKTQSTDTVVMGYLQVTTHGKIHGSSALYMNIVMLLTLNYRSSGVAL